MTISKNKNHKDIFVLRRKTKESEDIVTLKFLPVKGKIFSFEPGQFVTVYFLDNHLGGQGKAYSISGCPLDKFLTITVKKIGAFSSGLHNLKIGDKVKIGHPEGDFYPEKTMDNLVFLAGGIGITPFYSIIRSFYLQGSPKKIVLFYNAKTKKNAAFLKELSRIEKKWSCLKLICLFTREKPGSKKNQEYCRLNVGILKKYLGSLKNKIYFICGPIGFVNDLWKEVKKAGIKEDFIKTEAFY